MSRLIIVRHGQASFFAADYDVLSSLGVEQSRRLGAYWAERGVRVVRAFVGPRRRHRQTHEAVAAAYVARGLWWPEAEELPELDEHHGSRVVEQVLAAAAVEPPAGVVVPAAAAAGAPVLEAAAAASPDERQRRYLRDFSRITRQWARGELDAPGIEPFQAFRARVERAVARMDAVVAGAGEQGEQTAVAFTSGGPVAAAAGLALEVGDERTLELSWVVSNASVSEFAWRGERLALAVFNAAPHLGAEHVSMV